MWFPKRKTTLFILILNLLIFHPAPRSFSSEPVPPPSIIDTANWEGAKRFGDQSTAHFLATFYDIKGNPAVYLFLVSKSGEKNLTNLNMSIDEGRSLIEQGQSLIRKGLTQEGQMRIASGRTRLFQEDRYGTLIVSAKGESPSLISFHHGLPNFITSRKECESKAIDFFDGKKMSCHEVLYISPFEVYFEFESENKKILVDSVSLKLIFKADLEKKILSSNLPFFKYPDGSAPGTFLQQTDDIDDPDHLVAGSHNLTTDYKFIHGVPDYFQPSGFPESCGPTAGACLLGYWDSRGYTDLLQGIGNDEDVTDLIRELCGTMDWNPTLGVFYSQIPLGLLDVISDRGYEIGIGNLYGIDSVDIVKQEIIEGRPFIYGSQQNPWRTPHYVVVVGFQDNFIIVHDNWVSTPVDYFVNWDSLGHVDDMMTTLIPSGQAGAFSESLPADRGGSGGGCFIAVAMPQ